MDKLCMLSRSYCWGLHRIEGASSTQGVEELALEDCQCMHTNVVLSLKSSYIRILDRQTLMMMPDLLTRRVRQLAPLSPLTAQTQGHHMSQSTLPPIVSLKPQAARSWSGGCA